MTAYDDFNAQYPDECDRITRDNNLNAGPPPSLYDQFRTYVDATPAGGDILTRATEFFDDHALRGPLVNRGASDIHGHFCRGRTLEIGLSLSLPSAGDDLSADTAADLVQELVFASRAGPAALQEVVSLKLANRRLRAGRSMFSFQDATVPSAPFNGDIPENLLRRLALPGAPSPKGIGPDNLPYAYHYFAFRPPADVRRPTAFDAGMRCLKDWQPGGLTSPQPPLAGLPEFVHEPVTGHSVQWPFDRFD